MVGTVKNVNSAKGYGFIKQGDGSPEDVFFHIRSLRGSLTNANLDDLVHQQVEYTLTIDPQTGKLRAGEVHPVGAR